MAFKLIPAHTVALDNAGIAAKMISELMSFKASEDKDDPERQQGLHGPYEELVRLRTGKLPVDYYDPGDKQPWDLRPQESRSNILWQVLSGVIDHAPDFAAAYMTLALDRALSDEDYAHELKKLHKDWSRYIEHAGLISDHQHSRMSHIYKSVSCPACSILTATACRDPAMNALFREMLPLKPIERRQLLQDRNMAPLLNIMIPVTPKP
ncbi:MAG: hypothetical protein ACK4NR_12315 [Micavibrio sp.]